MAAFETTRRAGSMGRRAVWVDRFYEVALTASFAGAFSSVRIRIP
jgi:hypothetical protein